MCKSASFLVFIYYFCQKWFFQDICLDLWTNMDSCKLHRRCRNCKETKLRRSKCCSVLDNHFPSCNDLDSRIYLIHLYTNLCFCLRALIWWQSRTMASCQIGNCCFFCRSSWCWTYTFDWLECFGCWSKTIGSAWWFLCQGWCINCIQTNQSALPLRGFHTQICFQKPMLYLHYPPARRRVPTSNSILKYLSFSFRLKPKLDLHYQQSLFPTNQKAPLLHGRPRPHEAGLL